MKIVVPGQPMSHLDCLPEISKGGGICFSDTELVYIIPIHIDYHNHFHSNLSSGVSKVLLLSQ